ncbi:hypothetical protein AAF712_005669 [Marasmius tenuissimus]|uniref:Uncharacterized protein n=1 Tax=Marasmius tenuissimus TaxID=585030 RepID=A0ABR3A3Y6_9AGAR
MTSTSSSPEESSGSTTKIQVTSSTAAQSEMTTISSIVPSSSAESYIPSEINSTSGPGAKIHSYTPSELSFSTITPSDSVSQVGRPSKVHKSQMKRKPLKTSTDLSAVLESRESGDHSLVVDSTKGSGSEVLDRPKPVFTNPILVSITTRATLQTPMFD